MWSNVWSQLSLPGRQPCHVIVLCPSPQELHSTLPALFDLVKRLVMKSRVNTTTILVALVCVERWGRNVVVDCARLNCRGTFLVALIVARKNVDKRQIPLRRLAAWPGQPTCWPITTT
ncbi:hypothetical protein SCP_0500830 [Sparassis crispa]|uniref:Uncharacterized protein n=1 Tax=Sparassis crispa TaxID=139825 RepID=A0A401GLK8_9APHY|nr:hypothetical protein SCP_0500830 [Sparassis crispa]GBE83040.1 hypothetical protein SCP_0500830 [Sparassis crispa]